MATDLKLRDAHGKFQDFLKSKNRATATILAYGKDIEQLIEFLEALEKNNIHEVGGTDIQAFLKSLRKKGTLLNLSRES